MGKTSMRCPFCGAAVPVARTMVVPSGQVETCKGCPLDCVRYQHLVCPVCGAQGDRSIFVGRTRWEGGKTQDCADLRNG